MAAALLLIAGLTLVPDPSGVKQAAATPFSCLVCGQFGTVDLVLNVALFVPLGIGLGLLGVGPGPALALIVLTTGTVESLQALVIVGRDASLSDLLTNTTGGGLGFWLAVRWRTVVFPGADLSRQLSWLSLATWLAVWAAAGLLLQPAPPPLPWWGQLAPTDVTPANYPGTVVRAEVGGTVIPDGRFELAAPLVPALAASAESLEVVAVPGGATPDLASIVGLLNEEHEEALLVGQNGRDLIFRVRRRAADFRMRAPALIVPDAAGRSGEPLNIRARVHGPMMTLSTRQGGDSAGATVRLTTSLGWVMLEPGDFPLGRWAPTLTWLWIAATLFPVGYWGGRARGVGRRRNNRFWVAAGLVVAIGFWGVAAWTGCAPGTLAESLAAAAGLGLSARLGGQSADRDPVPAT